MVDFTSSKISLDGKHKQLVDLNKTHKLFSAEFTITPHTLDLDRKYQIAVVSQNVLDEGDIEFKTVNGIYTSSVKHTDDDSVYENFFLVIQSSHVMKDMQVEVTITPIESKKEEIVVQEAEEEHFQPSMPEERKKEKLLTPGRMFKLAICLFVIIGGCFLLYYFWKKNSEKAKTVVAPPPASSIEKPTFSFGKDALQAKEMHSNLREETLFPKENIFNPFSNKRSPALSIASKSSSDSSESFVFED
jgi:hypothetical protein